MQKILSATLLSAAFAFATVTVPSQPARAAETVQNADLRVLIKNAVASKQTRLVIPSGVYRVAPEGNGPAIIHIRNVRNLEIVADGVTMICTKRTRALQIENCENFTLRGLTVDYDPLTFTQGKVIAIADDKGWIDIKLDAGYPQYLASRIVICDPKTRFHKYGIDHMWDTKAAWSSPGIVRISRKNVANKVDLGDPVAMSAGQEVGNCHAITVENGCKDVVFRDVTIHCAPGMGLIDANNETGIKMFGCKITPGPKPAGATEERLLTTSWDGIQCQVARVGTQIENCVIESCGDDSWSVPSREFKVLRREGKTLMLQVPMYAPANGVIRAGDHLFFGNSGTRTTQTVQSVTPTTLEEGGKTIPAVQVEMTDELDVQPGQFLFNADFLSKGFIYRNNRIYSHGRGALVKVSDGIIEGNTFRGSDKAVIVNPEMANGGSDHLIIRNNTIIETGYHQAMPWSEQTGAICLSSSAGGGKLRPPGVFNDILIENNTFERVKGINLFISSAHNVTVKNNRFLDTHQTDPGRHNAADYSIDPGSVIAVTQSDGVIFQGNTIRDMGPFAKNAIWISPTAKNVTGMDAGVRLAAK